MVLGLFAVTCGGSVVEKDGDAGSAGEAGAAGDKGTGGTTSKGGSAPGGSGGWTTTGGAAGTGAWGGYAGVAGAGAQGGWAGTGAYGGWAGSGGSVCPPLPACNWCNGKPYYDSIGCVAGWICANGVDPCYTQPCWQAGCPGGQTCGADGLCWDSTNVCSPKQCVGTNNYCECAWSCANTKYQTKCKIGGSSMSCECQQDGMPGMACGTTGGGGGSPPSCQDSCCGFPE